LGFNSSQQAHQLIVFLEVFYLVVHMFHDFLELAGKVNVVVIGSPKHDKGVEDLEIHFVSCGFVISEVEQSADLLREYGFGVALLEEVVDDIESDLDGL
jgi:hypothetical protein